MPQETAIFGRCSLMDVEPQRRFSLSSHVRFRRIDDEGVFVLQESGEVVVVNGTGARIVEMICAGNDAQSIVQTIASDYELDSGVAQRDVNNLISDLLQAKAIEVRA